jgi:hypothetical protein
MADQGSNRMVALISKEVTLKDVKNEQANSNLITAVA